MNIGAMQSMMGINQVSAGTVQRGRPETAKFGAIFSQITSNASDMKLPIEGEVPIELIPELFNATTLKELEEVFQGITDSESVELSSTLEALSQTGSLEEFAEKLSINPEEILKFLQQLLQQAGMAIAETEELTIYTDMLNLVSVIDEMGSRFFDKLNEVLEKPVSRKEAVQLLAFIKSLELAAPKQDLLVSMEQKVDSFRQVLTNAAGQFEQRLTKLGKQEQLPFIQQKVGFKVVLETTSNGEGSGQKQADTLSNSTTPPVQS